MAKAAAYVWMVGFSVAAYVELMRRAPAGVRAETQVPESLADNSGELGATV